MHRIRLMTALVLSALAGCAVPPPSAPSVFALPGRDKPLEQFTADDARCRQYGAERSTVGQTAMVSDFEIQRRYDTAYVQCMYSAGHRVPVAGVFASQPQGTPPPPPVGPPPGAPPAGSAPAPT